MGISIPSDMTIEGTIINEEDSICKEEENIILDVTLDGEEGCEDYSREICDVDISIPSHMIIDRTIDNEEDSIWNEEENTILDVTLDGEEGCQDYVICDVGISSPLDVVVEESIIN